MGLGLFTSVWLRAHECRLEIVIEPYPNEPVGLVVKRFRKMVERSGVLADLRRHQFAVSPASGAAASGNDRRPGER